MPMHVYQMLAVLNIPELDVDYMYVSTYKQMVVIVDDC